MSYGNVGTRAMQMYNVASSTNRANQKFEEEAPARELASEQAKRGVEQLEQEDTVYGGRVKRANALAKQAKQLREIAVSKAKADVTLAQAKATKHSATGFDDAYQLFTAGGKTDHLYKASTYAGGKGKEPDGSVQIGPTKYKPVANEADLTTQQRTTKAELQKKWDLAIANGEMEEIQTETGTKYKIKESGIIFDPKVGLTKEDGTYVSALDPMMPMGTATRQNEKRALTQPASEKAKQSLGETLKGQQQKLPGTVTNGTVAIDDEDPAWDYDVVKTYLDQGVKVTHEGKPITYADLPETHQPKPEAEGTTSTTPTTETIPQDRPEYNLNETGADSGVTIGEIHSPEKFEEVISPMLAQISREAATKGHTPLAHSKGWASMVSSPEGLEFARSRGINSPEEYRQYQKVVDAKAKEIPQSLAKAKSYEAIGIFDDFINDPDIDVATKMDRVANFKASDMTKLVSEAKNSKGANTYNSTAATAGTVKSKVVQERFAGFDEVLNILDDPALTGFEYNKPLDYLEAEIGQYQEGDVNAQKIAKLKSTMQNMSDNVLRERSGASAPIEEHKKMRVEMFGPEGASIDTVFSTVEGNLDRMEGELTRTVQDLITAGDYRQAKVLAQQYPKLEQTRTKLAEMRSSRNTKTETKEEETPGDFQAQGRSLLEQALKEAEGM